MLGKLALLSAITALIVTPAQAEGQAQRQILPDQHPGDLTYWPSANLDQPPQTPPLTMKSTVWSVRDRQLDAQRDRIAAGLIERGRCADAAKLARRQNDLGLIDKVMAACELPAKGRDANPI